MAKIIQAPAQIERLGRQREGEPVKSIDGNFTANADAVGRSSQPEVDSTRARGETCASVTAEGFGLSKAAECQTDPSFSMRDVTLFQTPQAMVSARVSIPGGRSSTLDADADGFIAHASAGARVAIELVGTWHVNSKDVHIGKVPVRATFEGNARAGAEGSAQAALSKVRQAATRFFGV